MKITYGFPLALLLAAGCSTYPEHQSSYGTTTYGTQTADYNYATNTTYTAQSGPYYSSGVTQGSAASSQVSTDSDRVL